MNSKEIVSKGLQERKDVRAAEARAEKFRQAAADQNDARFYERNKYNLERADWLEEKAVMAEHIRLLEHVKHRIELERDELIKREKEAQQRQALLGSAKTILAALLIASARDLGWIVAELATVLLIASGAYLVYAFIALARKK